MKIKILIMLPAILGSITIVAMQQQQEQAQNINACARSLRTNVLLGLAEAIREERVDMNLAMQVLPQELRTPLNKLVTVDFVAEDLKQAARSTEQNVFRRLGSAVELGVYRALCYLLSRPVKTIDDLYIQVMNQGDTDTAQILVEAGANPDIMNPTQEPQEARRTQATQTPAYWQQW